MWERELNVERSADVSGRIQKCDPRLHSLTSSLQYFHHHYYYYYYYYYFYLHSSLLLFIQPYTLGSCTLLSLVSPSGHSSLIVIASFVSLHLLVSSGGVR